MYQLTKKIHVLARITPYTSVPKRKLLICSFFTSQLNYFLLTWMCPSRTMNKGLIDCIKGASALYSVTRPSFEKLLEKDGSVAIHTRNFQTLAIEIFNVYKNLSKGIKVDIFHLRQNNDNLKHNLYFAIPNVKFVHHGTESLSYLGPRIWNLVPDKLKHLIDAHAFKREIKKWKPKNCPCSLCKTFITNVGFI